MDARVTWLIPLRLAEKKMFRWKNVNKSAVKHKGKEKEQDKMSRTTAWSSSTFKHAAFVKHVALIYHFICTLYSTNQHKSEYRSIQIVKLPHHQWINSSFIDVFIDFMTLQCVFLTYSFRLQFTKELIRYKMSIWEPDKQHLPLSPWSLHYTVQYYGLF